MIFLVCSSPSVNLLLAEPSRNHYLGWRRDAPKCTGHRATLVHLRLWGRDRQLRVIVTYIPLSKLRRSFMAVYYVYMLIYMCVSYLRYIIYTHLLNHFKAQMSKHGFMKRSLPQHFAHLHTRMYIHVCTHTCTQVTTYRHTQPISATRNEEGGSIKF